VHSLEEGVIGSVQLLGAFARDVRTEYQARRVVDARKTLNAAELADAKGVIARADRIMYGKGKPARAKARRK
jgi:hypothetical protein